MVSLNVNGLRSHLDEIKVLMHDMKIDILALNETKLDSSIDQLITGTRFFFTRNHFIRNLPVKGRNI